MPPVVFLDRDGVINRKAPEGEYVRSWEELELLPEVPEAVAALKAAGALVVVVTNQRGVARGHMTEAAVERIHRELAARLDGLDAIYHCPHERGTCDCRKPGVGMFRRAEAELAGAELDGASMVGDAPSDMEAGATLGLTNVLVAAEGSPAAREVAERGLPVAHRTDSLAGAARWLLSPAGPLGRP